MAALIEDILQDLPAPAGNVNKPALRTYLAAREVLSVKDEDYGAVGDRSADDLAAFTAALAAAAAANMALYIPPLPEGDFYRLSDVWPVNVESITIFGAGNASLLCIANGSGANCITLSADHFRLKDFAICGISGSGNGVEVSTAHYGVIDHVTVQFVDGIAFKNTAGIGTRYLGCSADQNIGWRLFDYTGTGLTEGNQKGGLYVPFHALGYNTQVYCSGCSFNSTSTGDGTNYSLQVGDASGSVDDFVWNGGLIQGSGSGAEVYLRTIDGIIDIPYIEPPGGVNSNYIVTLDRCQNTVLRGPGVIQGDIRLIGACIDSGVENVRCGGIDISVSSERCFVRHTKYNNISTGPGGGEIKDRSLSSILEHNINGANDRYLTGDNLPAQRGRYFHSNMEYFFDGVPCGFSQSGGTLTQDSGTKRTGSYSAKFVMSADLTQFMRINLLPINQFTGKTVVLRAVLQNVTSIICVIQLVITGGTSAGTYSASTFEAEQWEKRTISFPIPTDATAVEIRFTGATGTFYLDEVTIDVDSFEPVRELTLDGTATPTVSVGPNPARTLITSGTPTITDFLGAHPGVPFTIIGDSATVVTDADPIFLQGGNFTFDTGDTLTLMPRSDGKFYQVSAIDVSA